MEVKKEYDYWEYTNGCTIYPPYVYFKQASLIDKLYRPREELKG